MWNFTLSVSLTNLFSPTGDPPALRSLNPWEMRALLRLLASPKPTPFQATSRALSAGKVGGGEEWNDAWETAWLPRDGAWVTESDAVAEHPTALQQSEGDAETMAFVEEMEDNWNERRGRRTKNEGEKGVADVGGDLYSLERIKKDHRLSKQRIHAELWVKEIERMEEAKLGGFGGVGSAGNEIDRLLNSASDIFDSPNDDWDNAKILSSGEFKNKPNGWETTSKTQDDNVWEMTQREEDILLQEFDRRITFSKFQIASFIKSHIFSRRRPIDGWKYMIEVVGPNAQKGKGSISRLPGLADPATQPFKERRCQLVAKSHLSREKGHATFVRPLCHCNKHLRSISAIPTYDSLPSLLGSCRSACEVSQVHGFIVKLGLERDSFISSKLLTSAINDVRYASSIFGCVERTNLFMFNTIIRAYSISGDPSRSLSIFNDLRLQSFALDEFSFIGVLKSCSRVRSESFGKGIHGIVIRNGCRVFVGIKNAILSFYGGCGRALDAQKLFDEMPEWNDLVSWSTLIGCYANLGRPRVVIDLFQRLVSSGPRITVSTMLSALSAGSDVGCLRGVEMLHGLCIKTRYCSKIEVQTSLIDAYARVGNVRAGRRIFDRVELKDAAMWNCMVHCYARGGQLDESLALFELMKSLDVDPIPVTLAGLFCCCVDSGAVSIGKLLHEYAGSKGLLADPVIGTALVDMYAKCGSLDKAREAFDRITEKDVKSWTAMISAYGNHGQAGNSLEIFNRMVEDSCSPNDVTLLAVLNACSHGGLVMESMECFSRMVLEYGISPGVGHYGCLIDVLGRSGMLEEAYVLVGSLPVKADASAWRALLAACRLYGNVGMAKNVKKILAEQFGQHPADSILLLSTGTALGCSPDTQPETESEEKHHKKEAGRSSILA